MCTFEQIKQGHGDPLFLSFIVYLTSFINHSLRCPLGPQGPVSRKNISKKNKKNFFLHREAINQKVQLRSFENESETRVLSGSNETTAPFAR